MKTLKKLSINPEKVIKNEVLMNLKVGTKPACETPNKRYVCEFINSIGGWWGCYASLEDAEESAAGNCASGTGICRLD